MLQNDMGNTRIQDSATGNIMGLSPGFIPVGMKEHGGIMYIASVNKDGEGEIGTIPSPIIRDFYKGKQQIVINKSLSNKTYESISNKIYPADKFIVNLELSINPNDIVGSLYKQTEKPELVDLNLESIDPCDCYIQRNCIIPPYTSTDVIHNNSINLKGITSPIISYSPDIKSDFTFNKGIYKIKLSSKSITNVETEASGSLYKHQKDSKYWFYHTNDLSKVFPSDLFEATLNSDLKTFPTDSKPGYLQVKLQNEGILTFGMLQRHNSPFDTPFTVRLDETKYETYFPGFYYTTESGIYVERIECSIIDQTTLEKKAIILSNGNSNSSNLSAPIKIYFNKLPKRTTEVSIKNVIGFSDGYNKEWHLVTPIINIDENNSYPQIYDEDAKCFYLTNITNIDDIHTQYRSSTIQKEGNTLPYSGLFKIELDDSTIKHWYKLKVVYYNQYDEKLGTYECRFNPYQNDVFGSNIIVTSVNYADSKILGKNITIEEKEIVNDDQAIESICFKSQTPYSDSDYEGNDPNYNDVEYKDSKYRDASDSPLIFVRDKLSQDKWPDNLWKSCNSITDQMKFEIDPTKSVLLNNAYYYLYDNQYSTLKYSFSPTTVSFSLSDSIPQVDDSLLVRLWYSMWNLDDIKDDGTIDVDWVNSWSIWDTYPFKSNSIHFKTNNGSVLTKNYEVQWAQRSSDIYFIYPLYPVDKLDVTNDNLITSELSGTIDMSKIENVSDASKTKIFTVQKPFQNIEYAFSQVENMNHGFDRDFLAMKYTVNKDEKIEEHLCMNFEVKGTKKITLPQLQLKSLYKIIPYFTLQNGDAYVSKLHLTDDVFYECNFETQSGIPINYLSNQQFAENTTLVNDSLQFSYYEPKHKSILEDTSITVEGLDVGIYVFNITAPSITFMGYPNVTITIGEHSKTFSAYRYAGSTQMHYGEAGYGIEQLHFYPIVIIVKQKSDISISISKGTSSSFNYQKEGLYKLSNTSEINSDLLARLKDHSYIMPEYQQIVIDVAGENTNKEDENMFKQTYGVFFRQAYSYVEGLYVSSNDIDGDSEKLKTTIKQITIGDTSYPNVPFIPEEPYILNYMWDKSNNYGDGHFQTAACVYCQPEEVLENRSESQFKFFPDLKKYDHNLTNQLRTFVLIDDMIKCQPSANTVLIKNNDENTIE